jgi:hypothetical protein
MFISLDVICSLIGIKERNFLKSSSHSVHLEAEKNVWRKQETSRNEASLLLFLTLF